MMYYIIGVFLVLMWACMCFSPCPFSWKIGKWHVQLTFLLQNFGKNQVCKDTQDIIILTHTKIWEYFSIKLYITNYTVVDISASDWIWHCCHCKPAADIRDKNPLWWWGKTMNYPINTLMLSFEFFNEILIHQPCLGWSLSTYWMLQLPPAAKNLNP